MPRHLGCLLICLSCAIAPCAAEDGGGDGDAAQSAELPPQARVALKRMQRSIATADDELRERVREAADVHGKQVARARETASAMLERLLERATRNGELDEALAIRKRLEAIAAAAEAQKRTGGAAGGMDLMAAATQPGGGETVSAGEAEELIARVDELDWSALGGRELAVPARHGPENPLDSGITVGKGERYLIIPKADDEWDLGDGELTDFRGNDHHWTYLQYRVGDGRVTKLDGDYIVEGSGTLTLGCNDKGNDGNAEHIRVKIWRIAE